MPGSWKLPRNERGAWRRRAGAWRTIDPCEIVQIDLRADPTPGLLATRQTHTLIP